MNKVKNNRYNRIFKTIGDNIRNRRKFLKISQEELGFLIGSTRNYIGCIERAEKKPSISMVSDIANALKCKICDLFSGL